MSNDGREDPREGVWPEGQPREHGAGASARECMQVEAPPGRQLDSFARLVETEIVPRLMLTCRSGSAGGAALEDLRQAAPTAEDVATFAQLLVEQQVDALSTYLDSLRARGMARETLLLQLLAPAARRLGALWEEDLSDFTQVTVGLGRLQQLLWHLSGPGDEVAAAPADPRRRALLTVAPGEQHTLGLFMVRDFFRRAGWFVAGGTPGTIGEIAAQVRDDWFAVVGLSLACERNVDALRATIRRVRSESRNGSIGVLVGGPLLLQRPELAAEVGADASANDGADAAELAGSLLVRSGRAN